MLKNIVLLCDYTYVEGGAAKVAIQTAIALAGQTELNVIYVGGCGEICDALKNSRVKAYSLQEYDLLGNPNKIDAMMRGIYNSRAAKKLKEIIGHLNPDETVVHIHTWTKVLSSSVFKLVHQMKFPIYLTIHDYFTVCPNGGCYDYVKKDICELEPLSRKCLACNCDVRNYYQKIWRCMRQVRQNSVIRRIPDIHYIFISEFSKKQIMRRFAGIQNMHMLKNPIEFGTRYRVEAEKNPYFLYIGRVSEEKGVHLFCKAVQETGVKGVVIGDGKMREALMEQYPDITFTGWLEKDEIQRWVEQGRCLVFPSLWYEGAPLTPLEVQAYGIPCIISDCNAAIDNIQDGVTGFSFQVKETGSLENRITELKTDTLVERMSRNTFECFDEAEYHAEMYVKNLLAIYESRKGD